MALGGTWGVSSPTGLSEIDGDPLVRRNSQYRFGRRRVKAARRLSCTRGSITAAPSETSSRAREVVGLAAPNCARPMASPRAMLV